MAMLTVVGRRKQSGGQGEAGLLKNAIIIILFALICSKARATKDKFASVGLGFTEVVTPVHCTNTWTCTPYCTSPRSIPACPASNRMGPEVRYGTCHCCDNHLGPLEQSNFGCSSSCSQVLVRVMVDSTRPPLSCPDKASASDWGYFSQWFTGSASGGIGPLIRKHANDIGDEEKESLIDQTKNEEQLEETAVVKEITSINANASM